MLSRIFGGGRSRSGSGESTAGGRSKASRRRSTAQDEGALAANASRLGEIRKNMEEEQYASGVSRNEASMADKLDHHRAGTLFKYAVIGNAPSAERTGIISRLKTYKAPSKISSLNLSDLLPIRLTGDAVEFSMLDALRGTNPAGREPYCLIDSVLIHFVPLDSFLNDKTVVTVQMNDFRKVVGTAVRVARIDNTMAYNLLFSLDFCVETVDLDKMRLSFACPQKDFQDGVSWGAVKVVAQVAFLSFPRRLPVIETLAVAIFADTDLLEYECDPRKMDAVLGPQALSGIRKAHERGEIENLTQPKDDRLVSGSARTIMGGSLEDGTPEAAIATMKQAALMRARPSLRPSASQGARQPKSDFSDGDQGDLLVAGREKHQARVEDEEDSESLAPGDSMSTAGVPESEIGVTPKASPSKRIVKFVG